MYIIVHSWWVLSIDTEIAYYFCFTRRYWQFIELKKDDGKIKKQYNVDRHGPWPITRVCYSHDGLPLIAWPKSKNYVLKNHFHQWKRMGCIRMEAAKKFMTNYWRWHKLTVLLNIYFVHLFLRPPPPTLLLHFRISAAVAKTNGPDGQNPMLIPGRNSLDMRSQLPPSYYVHCVKYV